MFRREFIMIFIISNTVTGRNTDRLAVVRGWTKAEGGGRRESRTTNLAYFAVKMFNKVIGSL